PTFLYVLKFATELALRPRPGCRPAWSRGRGAAADERRYTRTGGDCEQKLRAQAIDLADLSGVLQIEYADWMQFALRDLSERHQVALAQGIGWPGLVGGVPAADQDRLAVQQARSIGLADVEHGKVVERRLDGQEQPRQRRFALLQGLLKARQRDCQALVEPRNPGPPQGDQVAEAAERPAHVAGKRAHVGALAAAGLEHGGIGIATLEQAQGIDLH